MKRFFLDFETTGVNTKECAIHQASGIIEIDGKVVETFDFNVKPFEGAIIDEQALIVGHVSLEQIQNYELTDAGLYQKISAILNKYCFKFDKKDKFFLIGYNVNFDKEFLSELFLRNGDKFLFGNIWGNSIDVMNSASEYLENERPEMENFKLMTVVNYFNLPVDTDRLHNSAYDIEITRDLFYKLREVKNLPETPEKIDVKEIFKILEKPKNISEYKFSDVVFSQNAVFDFGKYFGKTIEEVLNINPQYIIWVSENKIRNIIFSNEILELAKYNIDNFELIGNKNFD